MRIDDLREELADIDRALGGTPTVVWTNSPTRADAIRELGREVERLRKQLADFTTLAGLLMLGGRVELSYDEIPVVESSLRSPGWSGDSVEQARILVTVWLRDGRKLTSSVENWWPPAGRDHVEMATAHCAQSLARILRDVADHSRRPGGSV